MRPSALRLAMMWHLSETPVQVKAVWSTSRTSRVRFPTLQFVLLYARLAKFIPSSLPSQQPWPEPRSLLDCVAILAGNCNMARLETTTADPVEGAVIDTECRCAADRAVNRLAVVPHATLKASVASRRRDTVKKCHFHQMSAVKDIRKGFMMGSDEGMNFAKRAYKTTN